MTPVVSSRLLLETLVIHDVLMDVIR